MSGILGWRQCSWGALACSEVMTMNFSMNITFSSDRSFLPLCLTRASFIVFNNLCFRLAAGAIRELSYILVTAFSLCSSSAGLEPGHPLQLQVAPFLPFLGACLLGKELELFLEDYFAVEVSSLFDRGHWVLSSLWACISRVNFPSCPRLLAEQPTSTGFIFQGDVSALEFFVVFSSWVPGCCALCQ